MLTPIVFDNSTVAHLSQVHHNSRLVALSLLLALTSSCAAFLMAHINRQAAALSHRRVSLLCSSLVLGLGIWSMHFIGMLAMDRPPPISYSLLGTGVSIACGIGTAWFTLWSLQQQPLSNQRIVSSSLLVSLGLTAMHYIGIASMPLPDKVAFQFPWAFASFAAGLAFVLGAFMTQRWICHRKAATTRWYQRCLPALLMTAAISSMHYGSMHALRIAENSPPGNTSAVHGLYINDNHALALIIAALALGLFLVLGLLNAILRYRDLWRAVSVRDARLNATVETAADGVITIDEKGIVQDFNAAAQRIFGYSRDEVIGHNISMLMPSPLAEQHNGHLLKHIGQPNKPITVNGREVVGLRKDGRHVPLQMTIGKALTTSGTLFVGFLQDISERKRTDAQLRIAASVFQHVKEGVAIVDANHNISDVNPAFERMMEKSREQCIGVGLESFYEDADGSEDMSKLWQTVATQHYWQHEIMLMRSNRTMWMQRLSISAVLNEFQRPHHFIAVISDVSVRTEPDLTLLHTELHDRETSLPSEKLFMDRLSNSLLTARQKSNHVGVAIIQLIPYPTPASQPKVHNYGSVLRQLSQLLQHQLRSTDTLARIGEDQLALLLLGIKDAQSFGARMQALSESIRAAQVNYDKFEIKELKLGFISTLQFRGTATELMELAVEELSATGSSFNSLLH